MGDRSAAEKMRVKPGMTVALLGVPDEVRRGLGLPDDVTVVDDPDGADFILAFVHAQAEAEQVITRLATHVGGKTLAWVAYPKGSKAAGHDLSRDTIWHFAETVGLTLIANVAIDATWSGLRLRPVKPAS
jgi:hypothetical protein